MGETSEQPVTSPGLGTFAGVFTPSILTILGIILFLRLGWVVGAAGLGQALLIILFANAISVLTSISLAAIATNLKVRGGGDYYLISRTLGVEYGGALGLVLFLAQSVSIAFYVIGFGEALSAMTGLADPFGQVAAFVAVIGLFILAWAGADWATKFQYVIMAVLILAIVAFVIGASQGFDPQRLKANLEPASDESFWALFAIFFPAVTGFTQGVSMSGDLRDPGKSLPLGTFLAVGVSIVVYLGLAVLFAAAVPGTELVADFGAMRRISAMPWLIDAGVISATLSSALASFMGAPRILQSLASDKVFPILNSFSVGTGPTNNPRRGILLSATIALAIVALGDLNLIAPVVSMFFLISYGLLNYATYFEARANSPSFRPRFRFFHARLSLLGFLGCLGAMLAIHPAAAAVGVTVMWGVHQYIARRTGTDRWANSGRSRRLQRVREDLHQVSSELEHPRDWRPVLLAFSRDAARRERLLRFATWLEGESGFTTAVVVVPPGGSTRRLRDDAENQLRAEIERYGLSSFSRAIVARDEKEALPVLVQAHGLGPVRTNTVLFDWQTDPDPSTTGLRTSLRQACNVVLLSAGSNDFASIAQLKAGARSIHVWYRDNATGRLMLLLAYLMTRSRDWIDASIMVFQSGEGDDGDETKSRLEAMLTESRISAKVVIVQDVCNETIVRESALASVVFLPFRMTGNGLLPALSGDFPALVPELGITALVLASQDIELSSAPEAGPHGQIAEASDLAQKAGKTAALAEKEAEKAAKLAADASEKLEAARASGQDEAAIAALEEDERYRTEEAEKLRRRSVKARTKATQATEEVQVLTGEFDR